MGAGTRKGGAFALSHRVNMDRMGSNETNKMDRKIHVMALAGILFLSIHTASAYAQNEARADIRTPGKKCWHRFPS